MGWTKVSVAASFHSLDQLILLPGRTDNESGTSAIVKVEEKGIFQKLKDVFWKSDDDETTDQKQNRDKMS